MSLPGGFASKLEDTRLALDNWWPTLTPEQRDYIIEHRTTELDADYKEIIRQADTGRQHEPRFTHRPGRGDRQVPPPPADGGIHRDEGAPVNREHTEIYVRNARPRKD